MRPRDTKTQKDLLNQKSDNKSTKDYWILDNGNGVTIAHQRNGNKSVWMVRLPKKQFNALIDWYNKDQKRVKTPTGI